MKTIATLLLGLCASAAFALDIQPYSPQTFADLQQAGKPVALHFHADWCPTCRVQEKVFNQWKGDATVPGTLLVANFDKEKELKKQYGVRGQSTVIVFKGSKETARRSGDTDSDTLRTALQSAL